MKRFLYLILLCNAFFACRHHVPAPFFTAGEAVMIDTIPGSCPYTTRNHKKQIVLSWIRQEDSSRYKFCYSVSLDDGKRFEEPIEIPGSGNVEPHGENLPKIIFKPSGDIIAAWGVANPNPKNKYSGLVFYSQSFDEGKSWTQPLPLTSDTASFDQRYFDLALLPNGEAAIVWLDNRKPWNKEGSALYYATTNGRNGFSDEKLIGGPSCPCCRTDLLVDRKMNIHVLYRAIINDSIRDMVHIVSHDNGYSFSRPARVSEDNWVMNGCPHTGPAIAENNGELQVAWFTGGTNPGIYFNHSAANGETFSPRDSVSGKTAMHCQLATLGDNILVVWNEGFVNNGQFSSRIGIEARNEDGKWLGEDFITPVNSKASFPVIQAIDNSHAFIAYTGNIKNRDHIFFTRLVLN